MALLSRLTIARKIAVAVVAPFVLVVALATYITVLKARTVYDTAALTAVAPLTGAISDLMHALQRERGASALYLGGKGVAFRDEMLGYRRGTDENWARFLTMTDHNPAAVSLGSGFPVALAETRKRMDALVEIGRASCRERV